MSTSPARAAAVTACVGALLALSAASAFAQGAPARTLVRSLSLADGTSTALVYRAGNAYQADILAADGTKAAALSSRDGVTGFGRAGDLHAALRPDGRLSSWVGAASPESRGPGEGEGPAAGQGAQSRTGVVRYKTAVRDGRVVVADSPSATGPAAGLRLDTLADGPGEGVLLLAAGGGIAAVGAAGLGFAMLRRGRTGS